MHIKIASYFERSPSNFYKSLTRDYPRTYPLMKPTAITLIINAIFRITSSKTNLLVAVESLRIHNSALWVSELLTDPATSSKTTADRPPNIPQNQELIRHYRPYHRLCRH